MGRELRTGTRTPEIHHDDSDGGGDGTPGSLSRAATRTMWPGILLGQSRHHGRTEAEWLQLLRSYWGYWYDIGDPGRRWFRREWTARRKGTSQRLTARTPAALQAAVKADRDAEIRRTAAGLAAARLGLLERRDPGRHRHRPPWEDAELPQGDLEPPALPSETGILTRFDNQPVRERPYSGEPEHPGGEVIRRWSTHGRPA